MSRKCYYCGYKFLQEDHIIYTYEMPYEHCEHCQSIWMNEALKRGHALQSCRLCGKYQADYDDSLAICYECHDKAQSCKACEYYSKFEVYSQNVKHTCGKTNEIDFCECGITNCSGGEGCEENYKPVWDNEWKDLLQGIEIEKAYKTIPIVHSHKKAILNIAIFGAASDRISKKKKKLCKNIGRAIGRAGHNLIFGAGTTGVMGAVAEGYMETNKTTKPFGSTTHYISELEAAHGEDDINLVKRACLDGREELYKLADIIIALPGGAGTSTELERYRTYKQLAAMCRDKDQKVRTWDGDLYLWKAGTYKETIAKWEAERKQHMADDWQKYIALIDFENLGDII